MGKQSHQLHNRKIFTIIDSFHAGGKERRLLELLKGLVAQQIACEVVVMSDMVAYPELYQLNIPVHFVTRKFKKDPSVLIKLYYIVRQMQPDLIQSWSSMTSVYIFPIARWLGIPFINAIIADAPYRVRPFSQAWIRRKLTFPFSDAIIGNSLAGLQAYRAPKGKSFAIHNGFDFNRIANIVPAETIRSQLGIATEKVVGMVGKFEKRKDYDTYLEAAVQVISQRPDVTFLAVGDGELLAACEQFVSGRDDGRIIFTGRREDVESIVNAFDIGVLTTNHQVHGEGISNALMEYMVLGKPVIATQGGGTAELIPDEKVGYIIQPGNPTGLAEKLLFLLDHPDQARQVGEKGRQRIYEKFNLDRMTDDYIKLYEQLLSRK
jgi:glycosyltransferase involved in cell wall biosynthesis